MTTLDVLYLSLAAGFLIIVIFFAYLVVNIVKTMRVLRRILYDINDTTRDMRGLKNQLKWGALGTLATLLRRR